MNIDEAGRDGEPAGVERRTSPERAWPCNGLDLAILDSQVRHVTGLTAAVDKRPAGNDEIEFYLAPAEERIKPSWMSAGAR
ncbi:hypothetical protein [Sorangium sp. So ce406]|uniref:hypothetical protein n=1 Tax=Sorangium sp. So ce406 TaxID=3133311 RepID=UPI003F5C777F